MSKKPALQIAEAEIERLREAYDALNSRAEVLEKIARTRLVIRDSNRNTLTDQPWEYLVTRSKFAGGGSLDLLHFSGTIVIGEVATR
jgi:hypothetical protein